MADPIVTIDSDDEGSSSGGGGGGSKEPQGATAQHDASQSTERGTDTYIKFSVGRQK